ncbi:MAG: hypothetical protein ABF990_12050 [Acetobacter sp.]|uniref:hypothetical protein n=1 Tax=Acetobacter sp. TaxID=440 RepID=UPI0039E8256A
MNDKRPPPEYWLEDTKDNGIPYARINDLFGDDETITAEQIATIEDRTSLQIRFSSQEMPEPMADKGETLNPEYLAMTDRPTWSRTGGWVLAGAWDNEDGEITLMYARPKGNRGMKSATACQHENFIAQVDVNRLRKGEGDPVTDYSADVRIKCADCGLAFRFMGLECGNNRFEPKVSVDATELRIPIEPDYVHEILGISNIAGNA